MKSSSLPLQQLRDIAATAARKAGHFIQSVDKNEIQRQHKDSGSSAASQIVTVVDRQTERIIREALQPSCDQWGIGFVGEESSSTSPQTISARFTAPFFWCVDPLDGTLPFVEGKPGYAVSIALVDGSGTPWIGVVYDPSNDKLLQAIRQEAAAKSTRKNDEATQENPMTVFADTSLKTQDNYSAIVEKLHACASILQLQGIDIIYGNGAVKNACHVLDYPYACYLKLPKPDEGGGSIWDFAASACIVREAGGWVSNALGGTLDLNRKDSTFMNHQGVLYASSKQLAQLLIETFTEYRKTDDEPSNPLK